MGIFYYCSKCGTHTDNTNENKLCKKCAMIKESDTKLNAIEEKRSASNPCSLYFSVWCYKIGYTPNQPWKIQQIVAQDMQTAAEMFVRNYDKTSGDMFFAKNWDKIKNMIVWVQDWRGRIAKFEIEVENQPVYYARRIK